MWYECRVGTLAVLPHREQWRVHGWMQIRRRMVADGAPVAGW